MPALRLRPLHSQAVKLDELVDLREVARRTAEFVGADLANLVNEAAIRVVRSGRQRVIQENFDDTFEKLIANPKASLPAAAAR